MLLSWQPVLGRGTSKSVQQPLEAQNAAQRLNLSLGLYNHHPFKATCQGGTIPKCKIHFWGPPLNQWEFQDPKMGSERPSDVVFVGRVVKIPSKCKLIIIFSRPPSKTP